MTEDGPQFGLVLPHFGNRPDPTRLLEAAVRAEEAGFDSLWVRDRLVAGAPHGLELEAGGTTFFEPLVTLAAVAGVTSRVSLGTAVLLPNRHPLRLLQEVGTLWQLSNGRLRLGLGLGVGALNFEALGIAYEEREDLFIETVAVLRQFVEGGPQTFKGRYGRRVPHAFQASGRSCREFVFGFRYFYLTWCKACSMVDTMSIDTVSSE